MLINNISSSPKERFLRGLQAASNPSCSERIGSSLITNEPLLSSHASRAVAAQWRTLIQFGNENTSPPPPAPPGGAEGPNQNPANSNPPDSTLTAPPGKPPFHTQAPISKQEVLTFLNTRFKNTNGTEMPGHKLFRDMVGNAINESNQSLVMSPRSLDDFLSDYLKAKCGFRDESAHAPIIQGFKLALHYMVQNGQLEPRSVLPEAFQDERKENPMADWQKVSDERGRFTYIEPPLNFKIAKSEDVLNYFPFSEEAAFKIKERIASGKKKENTDSQKANAWLNTLLHFPWKAQTEDQINIEKARQILDSSFFGMNELKNRIIEELVVRKLQGGNQGGIILLHGPPGTGKTAIAKAIAACMGRKFVRRSLSGVSDPVKILGHDYTYVGSKRGAIVDGLIEAGTINPVFQLDEVDKVGKESNRGNPLDALLGVLDPQQNHQFEDAYLELPVDLSKTLFILTPNDISDFPAPLLSRTEIIEFPSYFPEEKIEIASRHLLPSQLKAYGMPEKKLSINKESLSHLIRYYTNESGVRKLEEKIKSLIRKAAVYFDQFPNETQLVIDPEKIDHWLANKNEEHVVTSGQRTVGQVNGLYYSVTGGGIMPIQVTTTAGTGQFKRTGSLGDVMKEAADVGLSVLKSRMNQLPLKEDLKQKFIENKLDIHIHYPDGAVKKDGPSAGAATYLSLWSQLCEIAIPDTLALTGELDLKGHVGKIGGVLEKVTGALSQGVQTIALPESNKKDVEDLCKRSPLFKQMLSGVEVLFIKNIDELTDWVVAKQQQPPNVVELPQLPKTA